MVEDDLLRLVFTACHPVLSREARVALTLRLLGGLTTVEIARAFLVPESTVAQRVVRAKRTLAAAGVPFELPTAADLPARLASVLEVVYLVFNEGYAATRGRDWIRSTLCDEALRLARMLAGLAPGEAEVQGLLALLEIQASRQQARTDADGQAILLLEQERGRWDPLLIQRGLAALERAMPAGARWTRPQGGFFSWLTLPDGSDSVDLTRRAVEQGVGIEWLGHVDVGADLLSFLAIEFLPLGGEQHDVDLVKAQHLLGPLGEGDMGVGLLAWADDAEHRPSGTVECDARVVERPEADAFVHSE